MSHKGREGQDRREEHRPIKEDAKEENCDENNVDNGDNVDNFDENNVDNGDLCHYDIVVGGVISPAT